MSCPTEVEYGLSTVTLQNDICVTTQSGRPVEWAVSPGLVDYADALAFMDERANAIAARAAPELVWLLQHPPLYTAGTSARPEDLIDQGTLPVYRTGRGGQFTYHGPGQRVVYTMLDVRSRCGDVRAFVHLLEDWIIATLARFEIVGETRADRVGVWVPRPDKGSGVEDKIAAIGIRVRRWVSMHGLSFNVAPDLSHFAGIVPCGIRGHGVTSLTDLGRDIHMNVVDDAFAETFAARFGAIRRVGVPMVGRTVDALVTSESVSAES